MDDYTISESYVLPSKGLIYDTPVNPNITLRSMTTEDEMKRLTHSDRPYKLISDLIDSCMVGEKPGISAYDMCIGDYQFLLHRLRVVTYGSEYMMDSECPNCGFVNKLTTNLEDLTILEYTEDLDKYKSIKLPRTKKQVDLRIQTPRMLDDVTVQVKDKKKRFPDAPDPTFLLTVKSLIKKIDGQVPDAVALENMVRKLPMADTNYILKCADKLNSMIGVDTKFVTTCEGCGVDYIVPFRITSEFFGPTINV